MCVERDGERRVEVGGIEQKIKKKKGGLMDMDNVVVIAGYRGLGGRGREYRKDKW